MSARRRRWSAEEKLRIVLAGVRGDIEVSELCRREGINPTQYYGWKKQLVGSASRVFANGSDKPASNQPHPPNATPCIPVVSPGGWHVRVARIVKGSGARAASPEFEVQQQSATGLLETWRWKNGDAVMCSGEASLSASTPPSPATVAGTPKRTSRPSLT